MNGDVVYVSGCFVAVNGADEEKVLQEAKHQAAKRYIDRIELRELPKVGDSRAFIVIEPTP